MLHRTVLFFFALCGLAIVLVHMAGTTVPETTPVTQTAHHWQPTLRQQCAMDMEKFTALVNPLKNKLAPQLTNLIKNRTLHTETTKTAEKIENVIENKTPVLNATSPTITIVIDDVGVDYKRSARVINLPHDITLAFLPYAHGVQEQVKRAKANGHEIFVHMPMQPESDTIDPGPNFLGVDQTLIEIRERVQANLNAFDGYVGVNNHMGSRFTKDSLRLEIVMDELRSRGVMFLDSKTSAKSVAEDTARRMGVSATHRDVFLDHVETSEFVWKQLRQVEKVARRNGSALAIGHPKDITLAALEAWLPTLKEKGFRLISVVDLTAKRHGKKMVSK